MYNLLSGLSGKDPFRPLATLLADFKEPIQIPCPVGRDAFCTCPLYSFILILKLYNLNI